MATKSQSPLGVLTLGMEVKDIVTGLVGIAVARICYINGCEQIIIQPKDHTIDALSEGQYYVDKHQVRAIGLGIIKEYEKDLISTKNGTETGGRMGGKRGAR